MNAKKYKVAIDAHLRNTRFNKGYYVMVSIRPERYPQHSVKKLHARTIGLFRIFRKLGTNIY